MSICHHWAVVFIQYLFHFANVSELNKHCSQITEQQTFGIWHHKQKSFIKLSSLSWFHLLRCPIQANVPVEHNGEVFLRRITRMLSQGIMFKIFLYYTFTLQGVFILCYLFPPSFRLLQYSWVFPLCLSCNWELLQVVSLQVTLRTHNKISVYSVLFSYSFC